MNLKFERLHEAAQLPTRGTAEAAGLDLYATEDVVLLPGVPTRCGLGVAVEIPHGYAGFLFPRSGLGAKHGIGFPNGVGLIDSDYRGEIAATLVWDGHAPNEWRIDNWFVRFGRRYRIRKGDRIAQLVVAPVVLCGAEWADKLSATDRGEDGFGSTGK